MAKQLEVLSDAMKKLFWMDAIVGAVQAHFHALLDDKPDLCDHLDADAHIVHILYFDM